MNRTLNLLKYKVRNLWITVFWRSPRHLWALKVTLSIAFLVIPTELFLHDSFIGAALALGVVAMAIGETDVHPKGRIKSSLLALGLFFIVSCLVQLTLSVPVLFAGVLSVLSFGLTILGGINQRMQGVIFGSLLILVYTMLGASGSETWYLQPLLLTGGALCYSVVSITLLFLKPYRLLETDLARGFDYLSEYVRTKSKLFPSRTNMQDEIRNELAQQNIDVETQIEICKTNLNSYLAEAGATADATMQALFRQWLFLQELHERATSSHEQYDILSQQVQNSRLIEGFGHLMREIGEALNLYANSMLLNTPYKHPISLSWTVRALDTMLENEKDDSHYPTLSLLMRNLSIIDRSLENHEKALADLDISYFNTSKTENKSLKTLLSFSHHRFRFAVRITVCFLLGYGAMYLFAFPKGAWILMTSLLVCQQTYSATRLRLEHRVLGTLFGVILGILLAQLLPTLWGQILMLLGAIYAFFYWLKEKYAYAAVFITVFVMAAFNLQDNQGMSVMLPRIVDTIIGGGLAYLVVRYLWPDWQYRKLPELLHAAVAKNKRYFESIYNKSVPDPEYQHNRRAAHNADNALTSAWKGMRLEPKRKRQYRQKAYNLTYLNHTLLSYISAFGVHKSSIRLSEKELEYCVKTGLVLESVCQLLTNADDAHNLEQFLKQANQWEDEIYLARKQPDAQRHLLLIHNIARVSCHLLAEARGVEKLYLSQS